MRGVVEVNRVNHTGRKGARMQGKSFNSQKPSASPRVTESLRTGKPIRVQESGSNRQMESGKVRVSVFMLMELSTKVSTVGAEKTGLEL